MSSYFEVEPHSEDIPSVPTKPVGWFESCPNAPCISIGCEDVVVELAFGVTLTVREKAAALHIRQQITSRFRWIRTWGNAR